MKNIYSFRSFIGCASLLWAVLSGSIAFAQKPTITGFAAMPATVCSGGSASFTATIGNVSGSYNWTLASKNILIGNTSSLTTLSGSLSGGDSGVQSYTLTVTSAGQSAQAVTSLTVVSAVTRLYVKANATGAKTGLSWQDAFTDLQSALKYPCTASLREIWIARGTYKPRSREFSDAFSMLPDVAIYGGFEGTETDLNQRPAINLSSPSSTTLSADIDGDGTTANNASTIIYNTRRLTSTAILDGVVITPPSSGSGLAAIVNNSNGDPNETDPDSRFGAECSPQFRNLLFLGAANYSGISVTNIALKGGIVSPLFINCVFRDSQLGLVSNRGIGVAGFTPPVVAPQFVNCVIANNVNRLGSGSDSGLPFLLVNQSYSVDQSAFINCSFANMPEGLFFSSSSDGDGPSQNDIRLTNCVLWNTGGATTFQKANASSLLNVTVQYSLLDQAITSYTSGPGNLTATSSPFVAVSDFNLPNTSAAVNTGNPSSTTVASPPYSATNLPQTDAAAQSRIRGGRVDMGALEVQNPGPPCGAVVFVTQSGAGLQDGSSWGNAFAGTALQTAINTAAGCGAQVWVAQGIYKPTTGTNQSISFVMKNGVAIYGGFVGNEAQLSARPSIAPASGQPSSTTLSGDLKGDDGPEFANRSDNSYHVIKNENNSLNNTAVLDGFVVSGGNANGGNSVDARGGAIYCSSSSPSLINCSFQSSSASMNGGAIYNVSSTSRLINCHFQSNTASNGGAIYNNVSNLNLINCSFQANTATVNGGALYNNISSPTLVNCTLQANLATAGGAIYTYGSNSPSSSPIPSLTNSVVWNNGAAATFGNGNNGALTVSYSLLEPSVTNYTDAGNNSMVTVSPFVSGSSVALNACAPAINTGSNQAYSSANGPATDIAGQARIFNGGTIDRGAYEYQGNPTTLTVTAPTVSTAAVGQAFSQTFTASGGSGIYSFSVVSANLPASVSLSADGILSGTPTTVGSYSVLVQASDATGCVGVASTSYSLSVNEVTPTITGFAAEDNTVCVNSPITFTATIGNITGTYNFTISNGQLRLIGSDVANLSRTLPARGSGPLTYTLTVNNNGNVSKATTVVTVNALPIAGLVNNGPLGCAQTSVTLTASGGTSYSFSDGSGQVVPGNGNTRTVTSPGVYSVTVGDANGCVSTTTTAVGSSTVLSLGAGPSLSMANVGVVLSLTASGAITYQWIAPPTVRLTTPATGSAVSVSLTTAGLQTFTVVGTSGTCSQSALVSVTALTGPDLSAIINLPDGSFPAGGGKGLLMQLQEVNGAVSTGNIVVTITVPTGYSVSFDNTLTRFTVSGLTPDPMVSVDNTKWHEIDRVSGQQLRIGINSGQSVGMNSTMNLGFSVSRTTANSGSVSSITVNIAEDSTGVNYDVNRLNNVYARIINGL